MRPVSIRNVEMHLRQFLGALVEAGAAPDDCVSLRAVTTEANIRRAAQQTHNRRKLSRPPVGLFNMVTTLLAVARHHLQLSEPELAAIKRLKARLAPEQPGMTTKNSERLGQFHDHQNVIRLLALPEVLLQQAMERPTAATSPLRAMFAVAICILLACPMRMKNLASLEIEKHLGVHETGARRLYSIRIDAQDVKNGVPIEMNLSRRNSEMLRVYLEQFRHRLSMERIAEEGFNLNISRYISTAVAEAEIDLDATQQELVSIEDQIREATSKHNLFLRELGLPVLPVTE